MNLEEEELGAAHELEQRLDRDDERERIARRRMRIARKPRYRRFEMLARITDALLRNAYRAEVPQVTEREAA